jgi:hypothetical protein
MDYAAFRTQTAGMKPELVTGEAASPLARYEAFRGRHDRAAKRLVVEGGVLRGSNIDISWLPAAAETYNISADPDDYVLVDVPIVTVDIPNRNCQCFSLDETAFFDPMVGRQIYKTFVGKATHANHDNQDPLKAKGVHFDSAMEFMPAYGLYKIRVLTGWDRTKDKNLVDDIVSGKRTGYSMGAMVSAFVCSVCGATDTNTSPCRHMDARLGMSKGALWDVQANRRVNASEVHGSTDYIRLVYQLCCGVSFFETSAVDDPADTTAVTDGANSPIWIS